MRTLPTRVAIGAGEALDSYLERVSVANDLSTRDLFRLLTEAQDTVRPPAAFMMTKPAAALVSRLQVLSGLTSDEIERATLVRYNRGRPLDLTGLNPCDRYSFRKVAGRGWFPSHGSQVCPLCLPDGGVWQLHWRLPMSTVCLEHGTFLVPHCVGCAARFRTRRHNPLRPVIHNEQPCGNPLGTFTHCSMSVVREVALPAPDETLRAGGRIADAIEGAETLVLGSRLPPNDYLAELKNLTVLLFHLASRPHESHFVEWVGDVQAEAAARSCELRGPRWGLRPPDSAVPRGLALAEADWMLSQSSPDVAVRRLQQWLDLVPAVPGGPQGWLVNRTVMSPALKWLLVSALAARRHVGLQLDHQNQSIGLPLSAIPQVLDERTYRRHFAGMLATQESTGRLYASLCLARARESGSSWSAAAARIGLEPDVGRRTSRAASTRLLVDPQVLAAAVHAASVELPRRGDYRALEQCVVELARSPDAWFAEWSRMAKPRRRTAALPYAITWMWCEVAQGWLETSPAWTPPVTRQSKAAYRVFRDTLPDELGSALRALVRGS